MPPHPLTNFEIQRYYQTEYRFNGVYSRNNLPEITDGTYVINFDQLISICTHRIPWYVNEYNVTYFDSFGVEYIPKKSRNPLESQRIFIDYKHMIQ